MKRILICVMSAAIVLMAVSYCPAQDAEGDRTGNMRGSVTSIDWVGSTMTVDDTKFSVSSDMEVYKGDDRVSFSDIEVGDQVVVRYRSGASGAPKAVSVTVDYSGDFPT